MVSENNIQFFKKREKPPPPSPLQKKKVFHNQKGLKLLQANLASSGYFRQKTENFDLHFLQF